HRLFALHDRMLGAFAARVLARYADTAAVFLPFCDTDEEDLLAELKGRKLFELCRERLGRVDGMLAILHGPSLDEGVCMEIGYARRLGVPVVVLTTDFQSYALSEAGGAFAFPDPLIEAIVDDVVVVSRMASDDEATTDRFARFEQRNRLALELGVDQAVVRVIELVERGAAISGPIQLTPPDPLRCFIEPSPYWNRNDMPQLDYLLATKGFEACHSTRHVGAGASSPEDGLAAARSDWEEMATCGVLIANVDGPETAPGAALLIGAALAQGSRIFTQHSSSMVTHAPGREPNHRNLMIEYSTTGRFGPVSDLAKML